MVCWPSPHDCLFVRPFVCCLPWVCDARGGKYPLVVCTSLPSSKGHERRSEGKRKRRAVMKITSDNQQNMWPLCRTPENRQGIYLKEFTRLIHVRLAGSLRWWFACRMVRPNHIAWPSNCMKKGNATRTSKCDVFMYTKKHDAPASLTGVLHLFKTFI